MPQANHLYSSQWNTKRKQKPSSTTRTGMASLHCLLTDVYLWILNKGYTARGKAERELVSSPFNCEKSNYKPIV
jgi:hypothetical protein